MTTPLTCGVLDACWLVWWEWHVTNVFPLVTGLEITVGQLTFSDQISNNVQRILHYDWTWCLNISPTHSDFFPWSYCPLLNRLFNNGSKLWRMWLPMQLAFHLWWPKILVWSSYWWLLYRCWRSIKLTVIFSHITCNMYVLLENHV